MSFLLAGMLEEAGVFIGARLGQIIGAETGTVIGATLATKAGTAIDQTLQTNLESGFNLVRPQLQAVINQDPTYFYNKLQQEKLHNYVLSKNPQEVAKTVHQIATELSLQGLTTNQLTYTDRINQLASSIGIDLAKQLPMTPEYAQISSVYNGKNLNINTSIKKFIDPRSKLIYFELIDELGAVAYLYQNTTGIILPSYDTFTGAYSVNDQLPTTLTSLFAAFHDKDYELNGFTNAVMSDYKFISRLSQNFNRMTEAEKPFARTALIYFSTRVNLLQNLEQQTYKQGIIGNLPEQVPFNLPSTWNQTEVQNIRPYEPIINQQEWLDQVEEQLRQFKSTDTTTSIAIVAGTLEVSLL